MNNKHFKRLLKESITSGASSLFEEEEEAVEVPDSIARDKEQEEKDEKSDSTKVVSAAEKKLSQQLKQASSLISKIKNSQNLSVETFSQIIAYYFMAMYYDDPDDWKASLSSSQIFNTNLGGIFKDHQKRNENIICTFSEALDWVLAYPAYKNPDVWVSSLRTRKDQDLVVKLSNTLNKVEKKGFALSSKNEEYLKKLIAKLGPDFKMSDCPVDPKVDTSTTADDRQDKEKNIKIEVPTGPQNIKEFAKEMLKVQPLQKETNRISRAILEDIWLELGNDILASVQEPSSDDQVRENKDKIKVIQNGKNILKAISEIEGKVGQKIAYFFIVRFLARNEIKLSDSVRQRAFTSGYKPSKKDQIYILDKYVNEESRNLEEQRYDILLKRFNIK
jgi:hypothetical protein